MIDDLSMAHDNLQRELSDIKRLMSKDKHALIKANIALNKRVQELKRFSISKDELKEVLNSNENIGELYQFVEDEHSIRDVFAIIVKEMGYLAGALGEYSESYFGLEQQNKRYRELLKKIKEMTRYDDCREAEIYELVSDELEGEE